MDNLRIKKNENLITKFEFLKDVPGYIAVKDLNSKCKGITNSCAELLGWSCGDMIDKTDYDVPSKASEAADNFIKHDKKTIELDMKVTTLEVCHYPAGIMGLICEKQPLRNTQDETLGVIINVMDITNFVLRDCIWLDQTERKFINNVNIPRQYILTPEALPFSLSPRQQECLSLLIRGKTMKEMSYILGISTRTVEDHINITKHKLGCYNRSQLIEKAIDSGFLFHVPKTLLGFSV